MIRSPLAAVLLLIPSLLPAAELVESLQAFQEKLTAATASEPNQNRQPRNLVQLETLEMLVKRGDFDKAERALEGLGYFEVPPELQSEWLDLVEELTAALATAQQEAMESWRLDVGALGQTAATACVEATEPADLDETLIACAALQMNGRGQDNVLGRVVSQRLNGIAQTLEIWSRYLEFRAAGNPKSANDALRQLTSGRSDYPLLTTSQIEAAFLPEPITDRSDAEGMILEALGTLDSPAEIPAAIERVEALGRNPNFSGRGQTTNIVESLNQLQTAGTALEADQPAAAIRSVDRINGGYSGVISLLEGLRLQIVSTALEQEILRVVDLAREPGEDNPALLERALGQLATKSDYPAMIELIALSGDLPGTRGSALGELRSDQNTIEQFLAAQRFESAGDTRSAIRAYRTVVSRGGKLVPTDAATTALARLTEANPDVANDSSAELIEEIRGLRLLLESQRRRPPGFP